MIQYTEEEFQEMLQRETMRAATAGLEYGLNIAAMAFQDALEQAEFVEWPTMVSRVKEKVSRAFSQSDFCVSFETRSEAEEDDDGSC